VHDEAGRYIASVYDVVHDSGFDTGAYVSKSKFDVHERSWNSSNGARDTTGADDGRDKIDIFLNDSPGDAARKLIADLKCLSALAYSFFHIRYPDSAGTPLIGQVANTGTPSRLPTTCSTFVVDAICGNAEWRDSSAIIVVADHGGESGDDSHYDRELSDNYTIPFVVWAPGVGAGGDLYAHIPTNRRNPGSAQIGLDGTQPIRAHEAGNLALDLLGLPAIPGSVFNAGHDLELR
jgi:hypothetical protein